MAGLKGDFLPGNFLETPSVWVVIAITMTMRMWGEET
jgi:hypothetical protein